MKKTNVLRSIHDLLTKAPITFRERFRKECSCSVPTYYRNMRPNTDKHAPRNSYPELSNIEKKAAIEQGEKLIHELKQHLEELRKEIV